MIKPRVMIIHYREDNPARNTSLKLVRKGYAKIVSYRALRGRPVVLNPFSNTILGPWHRSFVERYGVVVVDASWKKLQPVYFKKVEGLHLKLPPLIAGNPINYGKPCVLSSIEAVASTLYITGFEETYYELLRLYKWMETFHELNYELLEKYKNAVSVEEIIECVKLKWGIEPC